MNVEPGYTDRYDGLSPLDEWRKQLLPDAANEDPALIAKGRALFTAKTCIQCHTIRGDAGLGVAGPGAHPRGLAGPQSRAGSLRTTATSSTAGSTPPTR